MRTKCTSLASYTNHFDCFFNLAVILENMLIKCRVDEDEDAIFQLLDIGF